MGMRRQIRPGSQDFNRYRSLLVALSEDLSLPLLQIKTTLEAIEGQVASEKHTESILLSADAGLQLIEAYRLALKSDHNAGLTMEPVAIGAVLQEVAQNLTSYASQYATDLEVDVTGKLTPVLAHKPSLTAALQCLSASMIRAQSAAGHQKRYRLLLGAHRGPDNSIATGVFSDVQGLSDKTLRSAHNLVGRAHQPLSGIPAGAASGVLIADLLCTSMWQPLRAAAHRKLGGLATTVPISKQMQFIRDF
jgi:hypothetical protein